MAWVTGSQARKVYAMRYIPSCVTRLMAVLAVAVFIYTSATRAEDSVSICESVGSLGPVNVTADCVDSLYSTPVIDDEFNQTTPFTYYQVSGHFDNTSIRFNLYFPPKELWDGRFFQFAYPTQSENATDETIGFGLDSHAYTVQVTGTQGYRAEAAAAKFSKTVASRYYGDSTRHIYGYLYGGSGGSFQTVGGIENTVGIWDGAVPIVQGIPISAPNGFAARALLSLVLRNKTAQIQEAIKPGGSNDPYSGLNEIEQAILLEGIKFGIPTRALEDFHTVTNSSTLSVMLNSVVVLNDPTYVDDFWTKPGYLGAEQSELGDIFRNAVVNFDATIESVELDAQGIPVAVKIDNMPPAAALDTYSYHFSVYGADGTSAVATLRGTLNYTSHIAEFNSPSAGIPNNTTELGYLAEGGRLHIDNRWAIAMHAYHRYQVPDRAGFYGFDQFRNPNGSSIYPQRPLDVAKGLAESTSGGGNHTGAIKGKIIVVQNLMDHEAFPWHADWYRSQVMQSLGDQFEDMYRLWYNDNAEHNFEDPTPDRAALVVPYTGIYEQALRDLSAWVENGTAPPDSTSYVVTDDTQVQIHDTASERGGIQPTINLTVAGSKTAEITTGQIINFQATIEVPAGTGRIVSAEWDFLGTGEYVPGSVLAPNETVTVEATFSYNSTGSYIPVLRVASQREGDSTTPYGRIMNLARVRVNVN
ncbi:hypothetical protein AAE478_008929 [Parahypoxylon ruwenzoriense]